MGTLTCSHKALKYLQLLQSGTGSRLALFRVSLPLRLFSEFGEFRSFEAIFWFKRVCLICTRQAIGLRNYLSEWCLHGSNPVATFVRLIWFESVSGSFWSQLNPRDLCVAAWPSAPFARIRAAHLAARMPSLLVRHGGKEDGQPLGR